MQAFTIVDKGAFRRILKYQRPQMLDNDMPHRTKLREEILYKAKVAEQRIREEFKVGFPSFISSRSYLIILTCARRMCRDRYPLRSMGGHRVPMTRT